MAQVAVGIQVPLKDGWGLDPTLHSSSQHTLLGGGGLESASPEAVARLPSVLAD